jgi:histidinol-phosphate aminotransferase
VKKSVITTGMVQRRAGGKGIRIPVRPIVKRLSLYVPPEEGRSGKLRLDFNENTVGCSPAALRALRRITPDQLCMYPEYEAAQRRMARHYGVRPSEMLFSNGVDDALRLLMDTFIEPGSTVLLPDPTFTMYRFYAEIAGARIVSEPYDSDMRFPLEGILRALRRSPRMLCLANPNNPTATLIDPKALARILDAAPRTLVLVDEAYYEFAGVTVLPWIRRRKNLVVSRTFSKAVGLAGLRLGALFCCAELADMMRRVAMPFPVNSAAMVAAEAALKDGQYLRRYVKQINRSRGELEEGLRALGARVFPSAANFLLVDFGPGGSRLVRRLARRNILLRDRAGELGRDGFVRVTVGTSAQTRMLLKAIKEEL